MKFRFVIGLFILVFGVILLLNNLGIIEYSTGEIFKVFWPSLILLWGFNTITESFSSSSRGSSISWSQFITGCVLLFLGLVFLGRNLGWFYIDLTSFWKVFWPLIIILAGLSLLRGKITGGSESHFAVMSGVEKGRTSWVLKNDSYVALMGGIDLNLTSAELPKEDVKLELTAVMGGIDIKIPKSMNIVCEGTVVLGGLSFLGDDTGGIVASKKVEQIVDPESITLYITGTAIMGGIDIKRMPY